MNWNPMTWFKKPQVKTRRNLKPVEKKSKEEMDAELLQILGDLDSRDSLVGPKG